MNKFVTWFHNRNSIIQIVIKLLLSILAIAALIGFICLLAVPYFCWIPLALIVAFLVYAAYRAISEIIEDRS